MFTGTIFSHHLLMNEGVLPEHRAKHSVCLQWRKENQDQETVVLMQKFQDVAVSLRVCQ